MSNNTHLDLSQFIYDFLMKLGQFDPLRVYRLGGQFFTSYALKIGSWNSERHENYRLFLHQMQGDVNRWIDNNQFTDSDQIMLHWLLYYIQSELINVEHLRLPEQGLYSSGLSILWESLTHGFYDLAVLDFAPKQLRKTAIITKFLEIPKFLQSLREGVTDYSLQWLVNSFNILQTFPAFVKWLDSYLSDNLSSEENNNVKLNRVEEILKGITHIQMLYKEDLYNLEIKSPEEQNRSNRENLFNYAAEYRLGLTEINFQEIIIRLQELKTQFSMSSPENYHELEIKRERKNNLDVQQVINLFKAKYLEINNFLNQFSWFQSNSTIGIQFSVLPPDFQELFVGPVYLGITAVRRNSSPQYWISNQFTITESHATLKCIIDLVPGHHFLVSNLLQQSGYPQRAFSFQESMNASQLFLLTLLEFLEYPFSKEEIKVINYFKIARLTLGLLDIKLCHQSYSISDAKRLMQNELDYNSYEIKHQIHQLNKRPGTFFIEIYLFMSLQDVFSQINQNLDLNQAIERIMGFLTSFYNAPPKLFLEQLKEINNLR